MVGEVGSYFGKGDLFSLVCNCFPDRATVERASLFRRRRRSQFMRELSLVSPTDNFAWENRRSGK